MKIIVQNDGLLISQNTKDGFIKCKWGGCFDMSYPESETRRGRVQDCGDICPTLLTSNQLVIIEKVKNNE